MPLSATWILSVKDKDDDESFECTDGPSAAADSPLAECIERRTTCASQIMFLLCSFVCNHPAAAGRGGHRPHLEKVERMTKNCVSKNVPFVIDMSPPIEEIVGPDDLTALHALIEPQIRSGELFKLDDGNWVERVHRGQSWSIHIFWDIYSKWVRDRAWDGKSPIVYLSAPEHGIQRLNWFSQGQGSAD